MDPEGIKAVSGDLDDREQALAFRLPQNGLLLPVGKDDETLSGRQAAHDQPIVISAGSEQDGIPWLCLRIGRGR
jgi:hypothetical protein